MLHSEKVEYQPLLTIRSHLNPLFSCTGYNNKRKQNFIFTAGYEGIIKVLEIPKNIRENGSASFSNEICWKAHSEPIWELVHHKLRPLMLSSSPDGVKLWQTMDSSSYDIEDTSTLSSGLIPGHLINRFDYTFDKRNNCQIQDVPTSMCWSFPSDNVIVGYSNSASICIFDLETAALEMVLTHKRTNTSHSASSQCNKVIFNKNFNLIISGDEDQSIRLFDHKTGKLIHTIVGHDDCITGLCLNNEENLLVSVGHDGSLRVWDIRTFNCNQEMGLAIKKYDESINDVAISNNYQCLASAGANGQIKILRNNY